MKIKLYTGIPGSGKTLTMLDKVTANPGRYIIATPRKELHDECTTRLLDRPNAVFDRRNILSIHSDQPGFRESVKRRIEKALVEHAEDGHCVILITHEALFLLDPDMLVGWHLRIDEVPDGAVLVDAFPAGVSYHALERLYLLEPTDHAGWFQVVRRPGVDPVKPNEYRSDAAGSLAAFHKAVGNSQRKVYVDLPAWEEARAHGRRVHWWSIWTPMSLTACASIGITGAGFLRSLLHHACRAVHGGEIVIEKVEPPGTGQRARPRISIHYYTRHPGSTGWWAMNEGKLCLVRISQHLERIAFAGYWSCNHDVEPYFVHRLKGDAVEPRQAGTNRLRHHTATAYIYSNKAQPADKVLLDILDLNKRDIQIAREEEDIIQFIMRGAIRDPGYAGSYDVHLYSQDQAEALRDYLVRENITDRVELVPVIEAGIIDVVRPQRQRASPAPTVSTISVSARAAHRREQDRARAQRNRDNKRAIAIAEGTLRKRGRQRKASPADAPAA